MVRNDRGKVEVTSYIPLGNEESYHQRSSQTQELLLTITDSKETSRIQIGRIHGKDKKHKSRTTCLFRYLGATLRRQVESPDRIIQTIPDRIIQTIPCLWVGRHAGILSFLNGFSFHIFLSFRLFRPFVFSTMSPLLPVILSDILCCRR